MLVRVTPDTLSTSVLPVATELEPVVGVKSTVLTTLLSALLVCVCKTAPVALSDICWKLDLSALSTVSSVVPATLSRVSVCKPPPSNGRCSVWVSILLSASVVVTIELPSGLTIVAVTELPSAEACTDSLPMLNSCPSLV